MSAAKTSSAPSRLGDHAGDGAAAGVGLRRVTSVSTMSVTFGCSSAGGRRWSRRRPWRAPGTGSRRTRCSGCRCWPAGWPRRGGCRRAREGVVAGLLEVVRDLLDAGLVADGRPRVLAAPGALGRVLAVVAVHLVEPLGLRVPRLEVLVGERPAGGDAVDVLELAEVTRPQAVERGAVELGGAADVVVDPGLERLAVLVVPRVGRDVAALDEDGLRLPVLLLAGQEAAPLEQQDPLARRGQGVGQRPPARTCSDDDDVVVLGHRMASSRRVGRKAAAVFGIQGVGFRAGSVARDRRAAVLRCARPR